MRGGGEIRGEVVSFFFLFFSLFCFIYIYIYIKPNGALQPRSENMLLVAQYEEGCGKVCNQVSDPSAGKGAETEVFGIIATSEYSTMEVGRCGDELHFIITYDEEGLHSNLGYYLID